MGLLICLLERCELMLEEELLVLSVQLLDLALKGAIFVDLRIQHQSDFVYLIQEDFDQQAVF